MDSLTDGGKFFGDCGKVVDKLGELVGRSEGLDVGTVAFGEGNSVAKGVGDGEDIRKNNCGTEVEAVDRLDGDFGCCVWGKTELDKVGKFAADDAVLGEIATCLAHQPKRRGCQGLVMKGGNKRNMRLNGGWHEDFIRDVGGKPKYV